MSSNPDFDRWYAATHVKFIVRPSHNLETFGNTLVNYHLISELDDHPGKIRMKTGADENGVTENLPPWWSENPKPPEEDDGPPED